MVLGVSCTVFQTHSCVVKGSPDLVAHYFRRKTVHCLDKALLIQNYHNGNNNIRSCVTLGILSVM